MIRIETSIVPTGTIGPATQVSKPSQVVYSIQEFWEENELSEPHIIAPPNISIYFEDILWYKMYESWDSVMIIANFIWQRLDQDIHIAKITISHFKSSFKDVMVEKLLNGNVNVNQMLELRNCIGVTAGTDILLMAGITWEDLPGNLNVVQAEG